MADIERFVFKNGTEEYEVFIANKEPVQPLNEEENYRDINLPTVDLAKVHRAIRGYTAYAVGAFRNFGDADIEKVTLKFNIKVAGKAGIPMLTEGTAESNFEIQVECKLPTHSKTS